MKCIGPIKKVGNGTWKSLESGRKCFFQERGPQIFFHNKYLGCEKGGKLEHFD